VTNTKIRSRDITDDRYNTFYLSEVIFYHKQAVRIILISDEILFLIRTKILQ